MRSARSALMLIVVLFFFLTSSGYGQEIIIHEKSIRLKHLTGIVVDATGSSVEYALIELRDAGDHQIIASTFADAQGKFSFADRKHSDKLEIRASRAGFNIVQYSVSIGTLGRGHLRIVLPIAT
jgi:hypothetical protein